MIETERKMIQSLIQCMSIETKNIQMSHLSSKEHKSVKFEYFNAKCRLHSPMYSFVNASIPPNSFCFSEKNRSNVFLIVKMKTLHIGRSKREIHKM